VPPPLPIAPIVHAARAGALALAWRMFREAGLEGAQDAGALALQGRLLKDEARRAPTEVERRAFYRRSAQAYLAAYQLSEALYPLVNAASLSRLAGDLPLARELARKVLGAPPDPDETAYYRAATPAEALLVLDRAEEARRALGAAIAQAPEAWADHASTIRQFELLLAATGEAAGWLDPMRPPRPLHFAGHMGVAPDDPALVDAVEQALALQRVGFGYGALAAGADIVIAEALLQKGAELHLVLPGSREAFREASVSRFGPAWVERFEAVASAAASVRVLAGAAGADHRLSLQLASEVAMGLAAMQAERLATAPLQLVVLDRPDPPAGEPGGSAWSRAAWNAAGRASSSVIVAPRDPQAVPPAPGEAREDVRLVALLTAIFDADPDKAASEILPALRGLAGAPAAARWTGGGAALAYGAAREAAEAAGRLIETFGERVRIGADVGVVRVAEDPFAPGTVLLGEAVETADRLADAALAGAAQASESFAAVLHAHGRALRTEPLGELAGQAADRPIPVFALG
jgi:tetratricopeptide (TPR) repeat protein